MSLEERLARRNSMPVSNAVRRSCNDVTAIAAATDDDIFLVEFKCQVAFLPAFFSLNRPNCAFSACAYSFLFRIQ